MESEDRFTPSIIAIDGPGASGKSTIGQRVASRLGYLYFDTGVMYRAVALAAIRRGIPVEAEREIVELAKGLDIDVQPPSTEDGRQYDVLLEGEDVTWEIRESEVNEIVSEVSAYPGVRQSMSQQQREIGLRGRVVMVGRDIGTVILPEADLKIYLDATLEARAERRYQECLARGEAISYEEVLESLKKRDQIDSNRLTAPLRVAEHAHVLDTTSLSVAEVERHVLSLIFQESGGVGGDSGPSDTGEERGD